ncbi:radical SAM protein [Nitrosopumilus sp. K4]|uniref:radical SAM protein n=1 Tax=Nitrosopumilus sp. K4 TaxID=2795383 RepID=UPI001BA8AB6C|nr:radical SAM protein [Nitrosopumilus sp. K4]QUC64786.1 radical SAM protein [Nitrosopumilus sp. K4]
MGADIITIKDSKPRSANELKKQTGEAYRTSDSKNLSLQNFDFNKKILFHPEKIAAYKEGERPFPTTIEVDLTNRCNHRCSFCFYAEHIGVEADKPSLETELLKKRLQEAKELGTKAISFTGGGEPTIHKDYLEMIEFANGIGLDIGTITNGSAITERNVERYVNNLQWIRISMAGGDRESYKKVQGVDQFELIVKNIGILSDKKSEINSDLNIGIRTLVTPDNVSTLEGFAERIKSLNINYYQLAPDQYSDDKGKFWNDEKTQNVFRNVKTILANHGINLLTTTYMTAQENLDYPQTCYAHFFMLAILAEGYVTFCKNARGEEQFYIGNINEKSLKEIWEDNKTKDIEKWVKPNNCGLFCKHMAINNTMEDLMNPSADMSPNFVG